MLMGLLPVIVGTISLYLAKSAKSKLRRGIEILKLIVNQRDKHRTLGPGKHKRASPKLELVGPMSALARVTD